MPNAKFDAKSFNPEAFKYIMDRIPRTRLNEIRKSKVLVGNPDIRAVLGTQNGTGQHRGHQAHVPGHPPGQGAVQAGARAHHILTGGADVEQANLEGEQDG